MPSHRILSDSRPKPPFGGTGLEVPESGPMASNRLAPAMLITLFFLLPSIQCPFHAVLIEDIWHQGFPVGHLSLECLSMWSVQSPEMRRLEHLVAYSSVIPPSMWQPTAVVIEDVRRSRDRLQALCLDGGHRLWGQRRQLDAGRSKAEHDPQQRPSSGSHRDSSLSNWFSPLPRL